MNRLEGISARRWLALLGAFIVVGGFALALLSNGIFNVGGALSPASSGVASDVAVGHGAANPFFAAVNSASGVPQDGTQVIQTTTFTSTTTISTGTIPVKGLATSPGSLTGQVNTTSGKGTLIEFSSDLYLESAAPARAASAIVALAYTVGGYVAYQSTYSDSAYVVIRVPSTSYQSVLGKVEALGNVTSLVSNSNDVSIQYTDLNATLASLRTEQGALLRLLNQSTTINSTLAIESQLQGVNQQINYVESQILQTRTLVDYATIDATVTKTAEKAVLSMALTATPRNGTDPLSVTFNAVVKGGEQPYIINYNFGDGTADQGQILIHTYYSPGDFKVTVTATDQNGTVALASTTIRVVASPNQLGAPNFPATLANLFVNVVEGIAEVAVVALPLAAVGAVVVLPLRRRNRVQKEAKQNQQA